MTKVRGWLDYWNGEVSLYVSPRHLQAHYRGLFTAIRPLLPAAPFTLLDFGCGEALMAPAIAELGGRVILFDDAGARRAGLRHRFAGNPNIQVTDELESLAGRCDLVLVISVLQYVPKRQLPQLLGRLKRLLKPQGRVLFGDILAPDNSLVADTLALLKFGWREGFLGDALLGLARTLKSDYRQARQHLGLSSYGLDELQDALRAAGLTGTALDWNIGHAGHRRSLIATLKEPPDRAGDLDQDSLPSGAFDPIAAAALGPVNGLVRLFQ